ncbi:type II toxin-antitoxin system VapC family toxin [Spirulina major CS-329]|uniref:type II toxin-antitoxin system VapC family toxin n=1 Tax=Spirulina TaxID=1154 RepID=UPI00232F3E30|nr:MULTISPECIES: type II toxin-antitoxin system VapC family toxin [Spirulina]MDB9495110.1 type II toxin-antitoxin system VapC family toxin [Spirulina subsalsa CS-330]MDB9504603.1 type II toxin-antitoxin system VapC family toxin [Spirulina major CS-329]
MSQFLLDTHTFIWLTEDSPHLSSELKEMINAADLVYVSIASFWEISIKLKLGKLSLNQSYESIGKTVANSDISLLSISFADTVQLLNLPLYHNDPFDRILIAQAINHSLEMISTDKKFDAYPIQRIWV